MRNREQEEGEDGKMKIRDVGVRCVVVAGMTLSLLLFSGCKSNAAKPEAKSAAEKSAAPKSDPSDLQAAMDKLANSLEKPAAPFHIALKKSGSDGFTYECDADVSSDGIVGKETDFAPTTKVGTDTFPANTTVKELKGTPLGSPSWGYVRGGMVMAYMNGHIGEAQQGVKYVGDEQIGGYDARRYDFDLANVDATIKQAMKIGNAMPGTRQTKDFNMKGSAWIAKDDGRMVKFSYDNTFTFSNGEIDTTHYEGVVTRK